jgi:acyl-CoA synthetase (AMP-forming)/AMP-acid ligase II
VPVTGALPDLLAWHARACPSRPAVVFVRDGDPEWVDETLSYAELDQAARARAARLRGLCDRGDRALLLYPPGLEFVTSLLGCLYAGLTAVPAPLPVAPRHHLARATGIAVDSGARLVLTDVGNLSAVADWTSQEGLHELTRIGTGAGERGIGVPADPVPAAGDAVALLQYTFTQTGEPRGVMVTHRGLVDSLRVLQQTLRLPEGVRMGSWLPADGGMGLVGMLLAPLYLGGTAVLMPPSDVLDRQRSWLELIDRYDLTATAGPDYAYRLCAESVRDEQVAGLDLSRLRIALTPGDSIETATVQAFTSRFAAAGFRPEAFQPYYGMSGTTLLVAAGPPDEVPAVTRVDTHALEQHLFEPVPPDQPGTTLVSSGRVDAANVCVVSPDTREPLPERRVGEIWVRGPGRTMGYWGKPAETQRVFSATTTDGETGFLRTGDLGVRHQGRLYVLGPMDEMLRLRWRTLFPERLEREVSTLDLAFAEHNGSAFTVPARQDAIVVVQELGRDGESGDLPALARRVRDQLTQRLGVLVSNVVFVRAGQVRTTLSGKVRRSLMRELFMADALDTLFEDLDVETRGRYRPAVR